MDAQQFWASLDKSGECWNWTKAVLSKRHGYGSLGFNGRIRLAHRVAYELAKGPIPRGMCVCHSCDNPPCCNPDHLWIGTNSDNVADRVRKGRSNGGSQPGESCPHSKLTERAAREILALHASGVTQRALAKRFNVHFGTVNDLVLRKTWKHLQWP